MFTEESSFGAEFPSDRGCSSIREVDGFGCAISASRLLGITEFCVFNFASVLHMGKDTVVGSQCLGPGTVAYRREGRSPGGTSSSFQWGAGAQSGGTNSAANGLGAFALAGQPDFIPC